MAIHRARIGMVSALALVVAACATGIAPAADDSQDQEQGSPPPSDPPSGSNDTPDTGGGGSTPDAGPAPKAEASTPPAADAAPDTAATATCTKTLTIPNISLSNSACGDVNTKVTKAPATLTYPCGGGAASATFTAQTFTGTVTGTTLLITNIEKFTLKACQFEGTQIISGDLTAAPLAYSYSEKMLGGDCSGFIICKATGNVSVK